MKDFNIHILGCGSALPTGKHLPTSQVVELRGKLFMIDCGEGAQASFRKLKLNFNKLSAIFISHLHGDHCFGLPGLLSTLGLLGRTAELPIFGPIGIDTYLNNFLAQFGEHLPYALRIEVIPDRESQCIWSDRSLEVISLPLDHRTPTIGYRFNEKTTALHLDKANADFFGVPRSAYPAILSGEDYITPEGACIPNQRLTRMGRSPKSYAYCSDTAYRPELIPLIKGVSLLYHEATFLHEALARARQTGHSTAQQAASIAQQSEVGVLMIGHYSSRYHDVTPLLTEAQEIFPQTIAANEGLTIDLDNLHIPSL